MLLTADAAPAFSGGAAVITSVVVNAIVGAMPERMLLLLDNCEHVAPAAGELAARLLRAAPGLRVPATGQRPLDVAGELLRPVPTPAGPSAVELFAARAAAGAPGSALDPADVDAVAAICRRLDGIPPALELAATRVRAWGGHEVPARLDDRFRVLTAGHRGAPARQRTLRAVLDWSWELLSDAERTVLRRLSAHVDGWTSSAAEAVAGDDDLDVPTCRPAWWTGRWSPPPSATTRHATGCSSRSPSTRPPGCARPVRPRWSNGGTATTTRAWPRPPTRSRAARSSGGGCAGSTTKRPTCAPRSTARPGTARRCRWSTRWPGAGCCAAGSARAGGRSPRRSPVAARRT